MALYDSLLTTPRKERILSSPQDRVIKVGQRSVINFCANNYLGLANHPKIIEAAHKGLKARGFGMASVRFICGTGDIHRELERKIAAFTGHDDAILYSSCFDANGGLFEPLLTNQDAIISHRLNHASIIDGIRLCKAQRYVFSSLEDLEECLQKAQGSRYRIVATDGVFSMDGIIADLSAIRALCDRYDALIMCDDCHATGVIGKTGRGTAEYSGARVDILTSTFGKALGGASGGFTAGKQCLIDHLRQTSRPYLFSNSLAPPIVTATIAALDLLETSHDLRQKLHDNTQTLRSKLKIPGDHPIVPLLTEDAAPIADAMLEKGIYVIPFSYPVVPKGKARIRVQVSAHHTKEDIDQLIEAYHACSC